LNRRKKKLIVGIEKETHYFKVTVPSEEELPLGVEAINEDAFDLDDLEEEELVREEVEGGNAPSIASTAFFSTVREVDIIFLGIFLFIFVRS